MCMYPSTIVCSSLFVVKEFEEEVNEIICCASVKKQF